LRSFSSSLAEGHERYTKSSFSYHEHRYCGLVIRLSVSTPNGVMPCEMAISCSSGCCCCGKVLMIKFRRPLPAQAISMNQSSAFPRNIHQRSNLVLRQVDPENLILSGTTKLSLSGSDLWLGVPKHRVPRCTAVLRYAAAPAYVRAKISLVARIS
jgi:hypothetical protein